MDCQSAHPHAADLVCALCTLAGALGLKGDIEGAKASLADLREVKPEINSIASIDRPPYGAPLAPSARALADKTLYEGLRRAGFPET